jgi:hypothetical protein
VNDEEMTSAALAASASAASPTPEDLEELAREEAERERQLIEMQSSEAAPKKAGELPPPPPIDHPTMMGQGPGGPHFEVIRYFDPESDSWKSRRLQLAPFTLKTLPLATRLLNGLPGYMQYAAAAWSRMPDGATEMDPSVVVATMKELLPLDSEEVTPDYVMALMVKAVSSIEEEEADALTEILHLAFSRYCTSLSREFLQENLEAGDAIRLLGRCLRLCTGLTDRFFAPSGSSAGG